jgi:hypothetical protein
MTEEQIDAAKWQMYENYKKQKAQYSVVLDKALRAGQTLANVGGCIASNPGSLLNWNIDDLPEKSELAVLKKELLQLDFTIKQLRDSLNQAGMDNL